MEPNQSNLEQHDQLDAPKRYFTVESANEALVLVRAIAQDVVDAYRELMELRTEREELAFEVGVDQRSAEVNAQIEIKTERLKSLHLELVDVGCWPKDLVRGLVDFPAKLEGRIVWLCWQIDEPVVAFWHEQQAGFIGRQPIDAEFTKRLRASFPAEIEQVGT